MKDIKELALKVAIDVGVWQVEPSEVCFTEARLTYFATRLIAAYCAEQKPDCWAVLTPNGSKLVSPEEAKGLLKAYPLFAAPPLTEPAPSEFGTEQRDKDWSAIKDAAPTTPLHAPSEANWSEDFEHENGQYQCLCCKCGQIFIGHKRRVVCKLCVGAAQLQDQVENLAALVNRLCRQVNRFDSGNKVAVAASKYICDNDLIGTSLRKDDEGIQKIIDMVKENSND